LTNALRVIIFNYYFTEKADVINAFNLKPKDGEKIWIVGDTMWLKATSAETRGAYTLIENIALPGNGPPPHVHENEDESMYVIDGEFEILLGEQIVDGKPGAFEFVPRRTVHRFQCTGDRPGKICFSLLLAELKSSSEKQECPQQTMVLLYRLMLQKSLAPKLQASAMGSVWLVGINNA
jgi:quercetin dioxygenase-like cupin family protein